MPAHLFCQTFGHHFDETPIPASKRIVNRESKPAPEDLNGATQTWDVFTMEHLLTCSCCGHQEKSVREGEEKSRLY